MIRMPLLRVLGLALAVPLLASPLVAQGIIVAPTAVFIDARARTAQLMLVNPNPERVEVELATAYGYTVTDSTGTMQLHMDEAPDSTAPSAAAWMRIFPRRLTLDPNAQQTVRLLASPPVGLADGEYWGRVVITTRGAKLPITQQTDTGAVRIGLDLEIRTIIPLLYRKGKVTTGATLSAVRAERAGDSLAVWAHIARDGNAAALGTVRAELVDSTGRVRAESHGPMSAYFTVDPRLVLPIDSLPPGRYAVRFEMRSGRPDLPADQLLPFRTARDSVAVTLP